MEEYEREFLGVWIPREIWLDNRLSALDKIILTEITSLDTEKGCWATNRYIADFCQCSITKVSTSISKLIELEYIYTENFNGRTRILKSRLSKNERQTFKKCKADFQKVKPINIKSNININTKERKKDTAYDVVVNEYTDNQELRDTLIEFLKMRKLIKKPMTDKALNLLLNKLSQLADNDNDKIAILNQSIMSNWQSIYPLKATEGSKTTTNKKYDLRDLGIDWEG